MKGVLNGLRDSILTTAATLLRGSAPQKNEGLNKTGNNSFGS